MKQIEIQFEKPKYNIGPICPFQKWQNNNLKAELKQKRNERRNNNGYYNDNHSDSDDTNAEWG